MCGVVCQQTKVHTWHLENETQPQEVPHSALIFFCWCKSPLSQLSPYGYIPAILEYLQGELNVSLPSMPADWLWEHRAGYRCSPSENVCEMLENVLITNVKIQSRGKMTRSISTGSIVARKLCAIKSDSYRSHHPTWVLWSEHHSLLQSRIQDIS